LPIVVFDDSFKVFLLPFDLLGIGQGVQWFHDVLNASGSHFGPFLLSCSHFFLLGWSSALLNSHKLGLRQLHALLKWFGFDSFIAGKPCIEIFNSDRRVELNNKKGFIPQFEEMCGVGMFSEVLAEIFVA